MALPYLFANLTVATSTFLDANFAALGALTPIPCSVTGMNNLTLSPVFNAPSVIQYTNYMPFVCGGTNNTGPATAQVGSLPALLIYKDSLAGPVELTGGEMVAGNLYVLLYDNALNSGNGGFHLQSSQGLNYVPANVSGANATGTWPERGGVTPITSATGVTLTAAQLTGGGNQSIITRAGSPVGGITDTTDTAANIVAALTGASPGVVFRFRIVNTSGQTVTLGAGSGVVLSGGLTTASGASHDFIGIIFSTVSPSIGIYG